MQGPGPAQGDGATTAEGHDWVDRGQAQEVCPAEEVRRAKSGRSSAHRSL